MYKSKRTDMPFLADIVFVFHLFVVIFILLGESSTVPGILMLHAMSCFTLVIHWYFNSNICALSIIESSLRGVDMIETISHRFISPIYDISETNWIWFCYILTMTLGSISIYKLYRSKDVKTVFDNFNWTIDSVRPLFTF